MLNRNINFILNLFGFSRKDEAQVSVDEVIEEFSDLANKTKAELTEIARDLGLSGYSSLNKADLVALIETSEVL